MSERLIRSFTFRRSETARPTSNSHERPIQHWVFTPEPNERLVIGRLRSIASPLALGTVMGHGVDTFKVAARVRIPLEVRGVSVALHVTILVTRNRLSGVGCCHWSLVPLVSPL